MVTAFEVGYNALEFVLIGAAAVGGLAVYRQLFAAGAVENFVDNVVGDVF